MQIASDITIRPALPSDAEAVFGMLGRFVTSYTPQRAAFDANYPELVRDPAADLLVAARGSSVVGYALASDSVTLLANGIVTALLELYVEEGERRRGVGSELVREAVARANNRGAVEVTVATRRAAAFYLTLGFESTAEFFKLKLK